MHISALGHSCVLLELDSDATQQTTRILVDPWLSDHATGDAMGRFPRLRFDAADLAPIHAVYLTHAHCDHLDPYTLVRLWRELPTPPVLMIPVSLSFLLPLFAEHLDGPEIRVLNPHTVTAFRGLSILGFFDVGTEPTNEDDVMVLVVTNGSERVVLEADARLSLELPHVRAYVNVLMGARSLDSVVYLTTENELTGTIESRSCETLEDRDDLHAYALDEMLQSVEALYTPVDDPSDLWHSGHLLRLVHGQGLTAPHELDARWQRILFPVRIQDRVDAERAIAARNGLSHQVDALTVGCRHTIVGGRVVAREPIPGLVLLDREEDRDYDPALAFFPELPCAPVRSDARDVTRQRARMQGLLDDRFLPYLHGLNQPPVLHLLASYSGSYRVRIHYGDAGEAWDYVLGFGERGFVESAPSDAAPQEAYWASDLEDFLDGRCDEYTPFCRTQLPTEAMRLWASLATPLLNSDLVTRKVGLHFERARAGQTPGSFILGLYGVDPGSQ